MILRPARRSFLRVLGGVLLLPVCGRAGSVSAAPGDDPERWWREWVERPRLPVVRGDEPVTRALLAHVRRGAPLAIFYHGGSDPGRLRRFSPEMVFRHRGGRHTYVSGYCHLRQSPRILRTDRIGLA